MPESLHVAPEHLRVLAGTQAQAARTIASAGAAVADAESRIRASHGTLAWPSAVSVAAVARARDHATRRLAQRAAMLSGGLEAAAARYQGTDAASGVDLDRQMTQHQPRRLR